MTAERLRRIERAEAALRALGIDGDLRVRYHGDLARIELGGGRAGGVARAADAPPPLARGRTRAGFPRVALDLRGFRSGST